MNRRQSMRIASQTEILRPPEIVFPWISEPEKAMKWQKNVKRGDIIERKPGVVGTTFKELIEEDGKSLEMYGIITRFDENKNIGFHITSKIHEFDVDYLLELVSNSTKVTIEANIEWKFPMNVISLFFGKKMKNKIARELDAELNELKILCET
ncbi:MAG: SRPBCC domain-containing protein [Candidatus Thiodiazotropha endolucinida]|nr:SRPBCC domain-containing protein [Candidatus Thiodiazotropha taylori]MCW4318036.1 SRPBCC domain-containing protein [Candidatus Thiodiazotropha taylori]